MPLDTFLALVLFAFTTSITPGPNNMMLFASGVNFGRSIIVGADGTGRHMLGSIWNPTPFAPGCGMPAPGCE